MAHSYPLPPPPGLGANRLLVKSCKSTQSGNWWFKARLTDKAGQ